MDMLYEVENADIMLVNGIPTTNFGYNADDEDEDWCLSIYGYDPEDGMNFEYYLTKQDVDTATKTGKGWKVAYYDTSVFELCTLEPVSATLFNLPPED